MPQDTSTAQTAVAAAAGFAQPRPVILGSGLTGLAISRALSQAGINHVLLSQPPGQVPRLGESLNAEGSLEAARQFPDLTRFFFAKRQLALFHGGHAVGFDAPRMDAAAASLALQGLPGDVRLLHIERIGFDQALFDSVVASPRCLWLRDSASALELRPRADRVDAVLLAGGQRLASSYLFDASNHLRVLPKQLGIPMQTLGEPRRVVFAHFSRDPLSNGTTAAAADDGDTPAWMHATSLLRLYGGQDPIDGLAWCIPLGNIVSVGIGIDPAQAAPPANVLLDWVEKAYADRGLRVRAAFGQRGVPVDLHYQHYSHARCHGRNWLLAGPTCCQVWFPSAAGVGSGLLAARLAPDLLRAPLQAGAVYQQYMDQLTRSHARLDWLARARPEQLTAADVRQQAQAMVAGNVRRLASYAGFGPLPAELNFGIALSRQFESDRLLANPLSVARVPPLAQAGQLLARAAEVDAWTDPPVQVDLPAGLLSLAGPPAVLLLVQMLSGLHDPNDSAGVISPELQLQIDDLLFSGSAAWLAWVALLRRGARLATAELRATALAPVGDGWRLSARWVGTWVDERRDGDVALSQPLQIDFSLQGEQVSGIRTRLADHALLLGEALLPRAAFVTALQAATAPPAAAQPA